MPTSPPPHRLARRLPVVVMGVSGSGKTIVGAAIATATGLPFFDGDDLHSPGWPRGAGERRPDC